MKRITFALIAFLLASVASAAPVNMIGDWTQGFSTDYATGNLLDPGIYAWSNMHPLWQDAVGAGGGPILYVNGRDDRPSTVWSKTFDAPSDTTLLFSSWFGSVCCTLASGLNYPGPVLSVWLNSNPFLLVSTDGPGVMQMFSGDFWTGAGGPFTLSVRNNSTVYDGNDFAMQDAAVSAVPTPEPTTLLMLSAGLFVLRRRLKAGWIR